MTAEELIVRLREKDARAHSVLVFGGTGISMWQYYTFLRQFALNQLTDFNHIYGISGGAACLWYYVLQRMGLFDDSNIALYEPGIRSLNTGTVIHRVWRLLRNEYLYNTIDLADGVAVVATPLARELLFKDFPLANFSAVAHDDMNDKLIYLNQETAAGVCMADAMASLSSPRFVGGRRFCRPIDFGGFGVSDLDFARPELREQFKTNLQREHSDKHIYWLNTRFSAERGPLRTYVKLGRDRCPRLAQAFDTFAFFVGIPNGRILAASMVS